MREENAIEVDRVSKTFKIYYDKGYSLRDRLLFFHRNHYEERQVLEEVSFSVKKGEAVGLIGHNGCGKSTTLKLLTKIIYPKTGRIEVRGRVSSLLELGAGFHPDMSGKENIYINASIFGLTKKEIDQRLEDIVQYSELEKFLDNPVRTYSSGMYMRLAFAVAINVNADVLLIDEILAVGDVNFREKCFKKLEEIKAKGTTIVIVSHSLEQIERFCDRSIWLHDGKIREDGVSREVHQHYLAFMKQKQMKLERSVPILPSPVKIVQAKLLDKEGRECTGCVSGGELILKIGYQVKQAVEKVVFVVKIYDKENVLCCGTDTLMDGLLLEKVEQDGVISVQFRKLLLQPGRYRVELAVRDENQKEYEIKREACFFQITGEKVRLGIVAVDMAWKPE